MFIQVLGEFFETNIQHFIAGWQSPK